MRQTHKERLIIMLKRFSDKSGFTAVEIVVTAVLLAMIGTTAGALIVHSLRGYSQGASKTSSDGAAFTAIQAISQDLRVAVSASVANGQLTAFVPPMVTDASGNVYYDPDGTPVNYRYYLSSGVLYRQIGSGTPEVLARDISSVIFSVSGKLVTIVVNADSQVGSVKSPVQCTGSVVMRNYRG